MPKAGFYAVESGRISFRRDGHWYTDEERIDNERIALLFSRSIRRGPDGGYFLQVGDERASIIVEDTPYVVRSLAGDAERGFSLILNDGTTEPLDPQSLWIGNDNVLYCRVKSGEYEARFLRPAYYHLSPAVEVDGAEFCLAIGGRRYPLGKRSGRAVGR